MISLLLGILVGIVIGRSFDIWVDWKYPND